VIELLERAWADPKAGRQSAELRLALDDGHLLTGLRQPQSGREAERAAARPSWRVAGAVGYLGFDMAVLWATLRGLGYAPAIGALVVAYLAGYLTNWLPIPGGLGVLDGGLAGALVLYGMPPASAAAAVLVYHAIALWVPSLGGLIAYAHLRRKLIERQPQAARTATHAAQAASGHERVRRPGPVPVRSLPAGQQCAPAPTPRARPARAGEAALR
jgi:hypothetical protein